MARVDWAKESKEADDEVIVSKTGAKAGMARRDWPKPLHESGRSLFGVFKRRMARLWRAKRVERGLSKAGVGRMGLEKKMGRSKTLLP